MNVDAFDAIQLKTIQNVVFMTEHDFGASEQNKKFYRKYIDKTADEMLELAIRIHSLCKYANSIYPESMAQWNERIEAEKKALESNSFKRLDIGKVTYESNGREESRLFGVSSGIGVDAYVCLQALTSKT